jgi:hypothetical protein
MNQQDIIQLNEDIQNTIEKSEQLMANAKEARDYADFITFLPEPYINDLRFSSSYIDRHAMDAMFSLIKQTGSATQPWET